MDKMAKTCITADIFVIHCFEAHVMELGIQSDAADIPHDKTQEWLHSTAKKV